MPRDSFFWAYKMAPVYILPLPTTFPELTGRIKAAAATYAPSTYKYVNLNIDTTQSEHL